MREILFRGKRKENGEWWYGTRRPLYATKRRMANYVYGLFSKIWSLCGVE